MTNGRFAPRLPSLSHQRRSTRGFYRGVGYHSIGQQSRKKSDPKVVSVICTPSHDTETDDAGSVV